MFCKNCGNKLSENEKFCSYCGLKNNMQLNGQHNTKAKKKNKWLLLILIVPVICFFVYGAIALIDVTGKMIENFNDYMGVGEKYNINEFVDYMNDKYTDDTFTYKNITGGHIGSSTKKVLVESEKYPGKEIRVIRRGEDENYEYTDTYLGVKYEDDTRQALKNALEDVFGSNFYLDYYVSDYGCTRNGSSYTTFAEYISDEYSDISFEAVVSYNVNDESEELVFNKIKNTFSNMAITGWIYFTNENVNFYGDDAKEKFTTIIQNKEFSKKLYFMKENVNEYSEIEWTNN